MTEKKLRLKEIESIGRHTSRKTLWEARFYAKMDYYKARNARGLVFEENPFKIEYILYDAHVLCQHFKQEEWPDIHKIYDELCNVAGETLHIREMIRASDPGYYGECIRSLEDACSRSGYPFKMTVDPLPAILQEGKEAFDVVLVHLGEWKIPPLKETMRLTNLGLREVCDIIKALPYIILEKVSRETALDAKDSLEKAGAVVLIW